MAVPHPKGGTQLVLLNGFMDITVRNNKNDFFVYDVKHTVDEYYWRKTRGQLTFYDLAVWLEQGQQTKVTALLQPLCKEPVKGFRISEKSKDEMIGKIAEMAWDVWTENHTPRNDTKMCRYCDVKHACSKFAPSMVNGKKVVSFL